MERIKIMGNALVQLSEALEEERKENEKIEKRKRAIDEGLADYYCKNKEYEKGLNLLKDTVDFNKDKDDIKKYVKYSLEYANVSFRKKDWAKVLEIYKSILGYSTDIPAIVYRNIGLCLTSIGSHFNAVKFFKLYKELVPDDVQIRLIIGEVLYQHLDSFREAIEYYEEALKMGEETFLVYNTLGHLYSKVYRDSNRDKQVEYFEKAYALEPENEVVVKNLAYVYGKFDEVEKADKMWQKMLTLNPSFSDLHSYGAYLVKHGRFQEGFKYLRYRFQKEDIPGVAFEYITKHKDKLWKMENSIAGKKILVHYEQGFGDSIMFIRYIRQLQGMCNVVGVVVQDSLVDLFKNSNFPVPILQRKDIENVYFDYLVPMMDLPLICGTTKDTIPYASGYLSVSEDKVVEYGKNNIKSSKKFKVGFAFEGAQASLETKRDIPLCYLFGLMKMRNLDMYCFQVDDIFGQLKSVPKDCKYKNLGGTFKNWEDTACAMKNMDLIITTDNGIMNLAGALGVKTFGLFNSMSEWRWFDTKGEDLKWYKSVKPFVCDSTNNWNSAIDKVIKELKKLV